jgi:hypothetical protein
VLLSGRTAWINPHGFLPAELYAFLPFFKTMTLAYAGLGLVWAILCFRYRAVLLPLQTYIGGVILLGAAEAVSHRLLQHSPTHHNPVHSRPFPRPAYPNWAHGAGHAGAPAGGQGMECSHRRSTLEACT